MEKLNLSAQSLDLFSDYIDSVLPTLSSRLMTSDAIYSLMTPKFFLLPESSRHEHPTPPLRCLIGFENLSKTK